MYHIKNNIKTNWKAIIDNEISKPYFAKISAFLLNSDKTIYPEQNNLFRAFDCFNKEDLKVVILGQDPYHQPKQADGLAFSISDPKAKTPPSIKNIFKELENDLKIRRTNINLTDWAKQGILLLNTTLTVNYDEPNSHKNIGWDIFSTNIIRYINDHFTGIVFVLWGNYSIAKKHLIDPQKHYVITSAHPSPLSARRGFFNSRVFSKINIYLSSKKRYNINW